MLKTKNAKTGGKDLPNKKPKASKTSSKTKRKPPLTNARLLELAAKRKPPQSWYDEDFDGI